MKLYLLNRYYFRPHITFDVEPKPAGAMQITGLNAHLSEHILECISGYNLECAELSGTICGCFSCLIHVNIYINISAHVHHLLYGWA